MTLPNQIAPQTLNGMKGDSSSYETMSAVISAHNQLVSSLGPGASISAGNFSSTQGVSISGVNGSVKRGKFTATMGNNVAANPTISLAFPPNTFTSPPFAQISQNGGTGTLPFTFSESATSIKISFTGTPAANSTYSFIWSVSE